MDLTCKVSIMASMMELSREGNLHVVLHIFGYLKIHHNSELVLNPTIPYFDVEPIFPRNNWIHNLFGDEKKSMSDKMPNPRKLGFTMITNDNSYHAGDGITGFSRTEFIVYLNNSPTYWSSKKQGGIEKSFFGSEFIALKKCCGYIFGLCYKLRMMVIAVDEPAYIYGYNTCFI